VEITGDPPGKIQEYLAADEVVLNPTDCPAVIVTSEAGEVIDPRGGAVVYGES
jgi:hypothetical protein